MAGLFDPAHMAGDRFQRAGIPALDGAVADAEFYGCIKQTVAGTEIDHIEHLQAFTVYAALGGAELLHKLVNGFYFLFYTVDII